MKPLIDKLRINRDLSDFELKKLIDEAYDTEYLFDTADAVRRDVYGNKVYIRGLIEISNYCKNDCYYCGIRCSNSETKRYRLNKNQILNCCENGYKIGFRTFVLQGGEDSYYTDDLLCEIISEIKERYLDCAVTLSLGERSCESYKRLYDAGADRYLLRHETADNEHYEKLHPENMSLENRKKCLFDLKEIGYQTGSGFMVGSPYQTAENLVADIRFLQELKPEMIGIGPFITHKDTPFAKFESGTVEKTLIMISILRLMFPYALIPSTTAVRTLSENGHISGLKAGANVVMPNLSPIESRKKYTLYDNKAYSQDESAEGLDNLKKEFKAAGYEIVIDRGDAITQ